MKNRRNLNKNFIKYKLRFDLKFIKISFHIIIDNEKLNWFIIDSSIKLKIKLLCCMDLSAHRKVTKSAYQYFKWPLFWFYTCFDSFCHAFNQHACWHLYNHTSCKNSLHWNFWFITSIGLFSKPFMTKLMNSDQII